MASLPQNAAHYQDMLDSNLPSFIRSFFDRDEVRVFIFEDLQYLVDLDQRIIGTFWAELRNLRRDSVRRKVVIFISSRRSISGMQDDPRAGHFLTSFGDELFEENGAIRRNVICIGPPGADEVLNLQRRFRLRSYIHTKFQSLRQNCEHISTNLRTRGDATTARLSRNLDYLRNYDWTASAKSPSSLIRLAALPGRREVADRVQRDIEYARYARQKERHDHESDAVSSEPCLGVERILYPAADFRATVNLSYALTGNPGTGKTIIARMIADAMKEAGILRSGHFIEATVQDLVAGYLGQSALKSSELLDRSVGGVLFIDEVQNFDRENMYHREAIGTILKYAEDHRGDISVIVATYLDKMDDFLSIDPGLERRFSQRIDLPDYDAATCVEIFRHIATENAVAVDSDLVEKLEGLFEEWINDRARKVAFSNAGSVRNLVEDMDRTRIAKLQHDVPLGIEHVPVQYEKYLSESVARSTLSTDELLQRALQDLDDLPGLVEVKHCINRIVNKVRADKVRHQRLQTVGSIAPGHYSFEGSPGTGKTTVARLLGKILFRLGVLRSGHVVEVNRADLVAQYDGQTGPKVRDAATKALDGVLFIDEAHNLIRDYQGHRDAYGQEAIGALTSILENERERLCVIMAGYGEPMKRLFERDQGWNSRFERVRFEDYGPAAMESILQLMCEERGMKLDSDLQFELGKIFEQLRTLEGDDFANARSVRNLLDRMNAHLDERVVDSNSTDPFLLTLADVPDDLRRSPIRCKN